MRRFLIAGCLLTSACVNAGTVFDPQLANSQVEAGSVTVSAFAPMRWDEVVADLRPEFNSPNARELLPNYTLVPITGGDYRSLQSGMSTGLNLSAQGQVLSGSQTITNNSATDALGVTTTNSSNNSTETLTRNAPTAPSANTPAANTGFATTLPSHGAASAEIDPILRARAAVGLHTEFVLLDHYLDQAYDPCLYDAWLVRVRLVVTPHARRQPYDVYTRLYVSREISGRARAEGLRVIPLLVTDNFERSDTRRYEQMIEQLQTNVSGITGWLGIGFGVNSYLNDLNALLGSQYNNMMSVYQEDDETLTVRLGAAFSPRSYYEMQARSYDVTFLLLADRGANLRQAEALSHLTGPGLILPEDVTPSRTPDDRIPEGLRRAIHAAQEAPSLANYNSAYQHLLAEQMRIDRTRRLIESALELPEADEADNAPTRERFQDELDRLAYLEGVVAANLAIIEPIRASQVDIDRINVFASSEFRHAANGALLNTLPDGVLQSSAIARLRARLRQYLTVNAAETNDGVALTQDEIDAFDQRLAQAPHMSRAAIARFVRDLRARVELRDDLHMEFTRISRAVGGQSTVLELSPRRGRLPPAQLGGFADVENQALTVRLAGGDGLSASELTGRLFRFDTATTLDGANRTIALGADADLRAAAEAQSLYSNTVQVSNTGEISLGFASARALGWNISEGDYFVRLDRHMGPRQCPQANASNIRSQVYALELNAVASRPQQPLLSFKATFIDGLIAIPAGQNSGRVRIALAAEAGRSNTSIRSYRVTIANGRLASAATAAATPQALGVNTSENTASVPGFGGFDLVLENLRVGRKVKVTIDALDANGRPILGERLEQELDVVATN